MAILEDVSAWHSEVLAAIAGELGPPFTFEFVERSDSDEYHGMLQVRHPSLLGLGFGYSKDDPLPDPVDVAQQVAAHPGVIER